MRRSSNLLLLAAAALFIGTIPAMAKPAYVASAKAVCPTVTGCAACHVMPAKKDGKLTDMGQYLMDTKAKKHAKEVDVTWLKDYKAKK